MHRHQSAFTLVELVVVLVLLSVLAIAAGSRFFDTNAFTGRFDSDATLAALGYARKLAVASRCPVQVRIANQGYALSRRQNCDSGGFNRPVPHPGGIVCEGCLLCDNSLTTHYAYCPGNGLTSTATRIEFDGQGRASANGPPGNEVTVQVAGEDIVVVKETGFAYVR